MAKKYIDADLLQKEIERRKKVINAIVFNDEYNDLLAWIDSLQQEQSCEDLKKAAEVRAGRWDNVEVYRKSVSRK